MGDHHIIRESDFGLEWHPKPGRRSIPRFLAVDLFCGAGGTTRGLLDAGGYVVCGVDKDAKAAQTFIENNPNHKLDRSYPIFLNIDIYPKSDGYPAGQQHILIKELRSLLAPLQTRYPNIPLLFAVCAPCQPFTTLSRKQLSKERDRARLRDARLLEEALQIIKEFDPEIILSENVAGINASKYGNIWQSFEQGLIFRGYYTASQIVCASNFGIAQKRRRSILVAIKRERMPKGQTLDLPACDSEAKPINVQDVLTDLPPLEAGHAHPSVPNHRAAGLTEINLRRLKSAPPGESNVALARTAFGDLRLKCHIKTERRYKKDCFGDSYGRMLPNRPSPTITTKCYSITNGRFGHFAQDRAISLREAANIQSFPTNYRFYPENQIVPVARMIGNAVPPKLAAFFANLVVSLLEAKK